MYAVHALFNFLESAADGPGCSVAGLKKQLKNEYGVDVNSVIDRSKAPPLTDEEIENAIRIIGISER
jgi:hypothetical protein